jgi:hypothetical protein
MQSGRRFFATVEPWHGSEVVVYNEQGGTWIRRVIYDQIASGHEIAVVDLNGDGRADVIANDNSRLPGAGRAGAGRGRGRGADDGAARGDGTATANPDAAAGAAAARGGQGAQAAGRGAARTPNPGVHVFYAPDDPGKGEWGLPARRKPAGHERLCKRRY